MEIEIAAIGARLRATSRGPARQHGGEAPAATAKPGEGGADGHPQDAGNLRHVLAGPDEDEHRALPGVHQSQHLQNGASLDGAVRGRLLARDERQRIRDGELPAAVRLLVVLRGLVDVSVL
nr:hypothetical protein [Sorangium sp. Soce836]